MRRGYDEDEDEEEVLNGLVTSVKLVTSPKQVPSPGHATSSGNIIYTGNRLKQVTSPGKGKTSQKSPSSADITCTVSGLSTFSLHSFFVQQQQDGLL